MQRLPLAQPSADEVAYREREGSTSPNLSRAIANAPKVAELFLQLTRSVSTDMTARQRELIILLVGLQTSNAYCWGHHVPLGVAGGISREEIVAIRKGDLAAFPADERALLAFCGAMIAERVTDELWVEMSRGRTREEALRIVMLVGVYCMIGKVQGVLRIPQDEGFGGFEEPSAGH